ncbi:hypothetical protein MARA_37990 [Mycolicibacterium arabiense]|uniref:Uncharacterized protein n=1 Tax=Mycolicibacterium arabiense TaxID=1286181 RepID=A0A7I7S1T7_9MYCO|nr:hypothetical protein [Mycolicibacterium arabiense]MCV7371621.1 hypothetical protein [Mycolicibacterium arabiense]BBY50331.1 hypothetical protein MARA_37990 [Mycolicibacterium arabiense]
MRELGDIDAELMTAVWDVVHDDGAQGSTRRVEQLLDERILAMTEPPVAMGR